MLTASRGSELLSCIGPYWAICPVSPGINFGYNARGGGGQRKQLEFACIVPLSFFMNYNDRISVATEYFQVIPNNVVQLFTEIRVIFLAIIF